MPPRSRPSSILYWSRRRFAGTLTGALTGTALTAGTARAAANPRVVAVPHLAFGAVVAAIGGDDITVKLDAALPVATMQLGSTPVTVTERLLLKGQGEDRRNYLDDARNAPKLGAMVRDQLRTRWPELAESFATRHKRWSHDLVRDILRWTQQLAGAGLRGKRVRDPGGRIYLLEWAGATVTRDGSDAPAGLVRAPTQLRTATPASYRQYVQALVDALR
ncbi:MAG: hypothetical protein AAGF11_11020 [Myxococcota bacterium]